MYRMIVGFSLLPLGLKTVTFYLSKRDRLLKQLIHCVVRKRIRRRSGVIHRVMKNQKHPRKFYIKGKNKNRKGK